MVDRSLAGLRSARPLDLSSGTYSILPTEPPFLERELALSAVVHD